MNPRSADLCRKRFRRWLPLVAGLLAAPVLLAQGAAADPSGSLPADWIEVVQRLEAQGPVALFLMLVVATFVSEDLTCIGAGLLAASGAIPLPLAILACFTGILIGDCGLYAIGAILGRPALARVPMRWLVSPGAVRRATAWFSRRGPVIIVSSRFMPGTRLATYFAAGVLHTGFRRFLFYFSIAALIWTPLVVGASSLAGRKVLEYYEVWEDYALPLAGGFLLLLYLILHYVVPLATWRGRRLLLSKWRRAVKWEFWPIWKLNGPVFLYVLYLGFIRFRSPTLFTVTNPGIPHSGFLGESKSEILRNLAGAGDAVATWTLLPYPAPVEDNLQVLELWMERHGFEYPVVLKPDTGERGLAVKIIRSEAQARDYLSVARVAVIAQRYISGIEFGVFYYRFPDATCGVIPSVTRKVLIEVVGDGERNLETLILADDRAVCLAPMFIDRHGDRCFEVPARGERVPLVEVGTHARGALFLDAGHLITPELTARIDAIARTFEGFHYGRFDIRTDSEESLCAGRNLHILELNGLTAEATHIYDPKHGVFHAWATYFRQWRIAFEIARMNVELGHRPWAVRRFLGHWMRAADRRQEILSSEG